MSSELPHSISAAGPGFLPLVYVVNTALPPISGRAGSITRFERCDGKDCSCPLPGSRRGYKPLEFNDKLLKCSDCSSDFVFTAGEQLFFHDKQFKNDPKRCKLCKTKRASGTSAVRSETRTNCSACGMETTVPFKPTQGRPVLCRSCFQQRRAPAITLSA